MFVRSPPRRRQFSIMLLGLVQCRLGFPHPEESRRGDFIVLARRMRESYLGTLSYRDAARYLSTISASGEWSDVSYADRGVGYWRPIKHLERVRAIAAAWTVPGSSLHGSMEAKDAVVEALRAWLKRKPGSDNWWHEAIGQQLCLIPTLIFMWDSLPIDVQDGCVELLNVPERLPEDLNAAQNVIWYAIEQLARGVLRRRDDDLTVVRGRLIQLLAPTNGEGIQADMSFHQHGPQLYSGGYGLDFLEDVCKLVGWLNGTRWQLGGGAIEFLSEYAVIGVGSLIRGDWLDWSARGREFTRQESIPRVRSLGVTFKSLRDLAPSKQWAALDSLLARMKPEGRQEKVNPYSRAFWRSDFVAHQTSSGYFSVKMCSPQTVGTESGNGENLLGYWLPFGATFFVRQGNEYDGLPAVMNWASIPGVTCPDEVPPLRGYQYHKDGLAACVSGEQGSVAGLQLNILQTRARKAWFLLGDTLVALGAGIESSHAAPVRTTLNQTRWQGELLQDGAVARSGGERAGLRSVMLNGIRYEALEDTRFQCLAEDSRTSIDRSNVTLGVRGTVSASIVTLQIDHGRQPRSARYAYAVTFAGPSGQFDQASVLVNSPDLQAVRWADGRHIMAVFHSAGELALDAGRTLQMSHPCVVVLAGTVGQTVELSVSCLDANGPALTVVLRNGAHVNTTKLRQEQTRAKAPITLSLRT